MAVHQRHLKGSHLERKLTKKVQQQVLKQQNRLLVVLITFVFEIKSETMPVNIVQYCIQLLCTRVYSSCVQSVMLHASETWPLTKPNIQCLQRNDRAMIRQICNVKPQDIVTIRSIEDLDFILKERMLCWYGPVEHSNGDVKTACDIQADGKRGLGRHKMTWKQLTERDCRKWKLSAINPHDRHT